MLIVRIIVWGGKHPGGGHPLLITNQRREWIEVEGAPLRGVRMDGRYLVGASRGAPGRKYTYEVKAKSGNRIPPT